MPSTKTLNRLRGLALSATEVKSLTDWPQAMVEDYLNILDSLILISDLLDIEIDQKVEEIPTALENGSILYVKDGFLAEMNDELKWDDSTSSLLVNGRDVIRYAIGKC